MSRLALCIGWARTTTNCENTAPSAMGNLTGYL